MVGWLAGGGDQYGLPAGHWPPAEVGEDSREIAQRGVLHFGGGGGRGYHRAVTPSAFVCAPVAALASGNPT